ncbi:MAG: 1-deoxy-D-xylulose-5-phosphate synthase, partial [Lachnospiraceae bacterium]|nr:1-deoxy-D-xylulose-5-phosphate synthase [Lachnospiraceae bacterium]
IDATLVNARFTKPLDTEMLTSLAKEHKLVVTMEENVIKGGLGEAVLDYYNSEKINTPVEIVALEDDYVEHGNVDILRKELGIDSESIVEKILKRL